MILKSVYSIVLKFRTCFAKYKQILELRFFKNTNKFSNMTILKSLNIFYTWTFFKLDFFSNQKQFLNLNKNWKNRNKFWILDNILECERFLKNLIMGKESYFNYFFRFQNCLCFQQFVLFCQKGFTLQRMFGVLKNSSCFKKVMFFKNCS